jgi:hypothetical protein
MEQYKRLNRYKITFIFLLFFQTIFSQYSEDFYKYSKLFPESQKVRLLQETIITIKLDDGKLNIEEENIEEDLYLNESATFNSKSSLRFSSFFEKKSIQASSYSFQEGKYTENKVEEFTEKDDLNQSFHDDTKIVNFIYPDLKKGSKSRLEYSQIIKNPRFLSAFYFADYYPIIKNKVTIIADKGIGIEFREFNTKNSNISFNIEEKRRKNIYTWVRKNSEDFEYERGTPDLRTILPHIIPIINNYKIKKETKRVLGEVSDLYNWYYSLVKDVNTEDPDNELVNLVGQITKDKITDLEKVKAIYYWTQKNIKYIAFEYALGGFVPRESNDVYRKKYGDCKDNSSILYRMLEIAGVKGNLTWIGTRSIPYKYEEVPTPAVDNHMILSYKDSDGKIYYLDATGRYIKFGLPTSFIQGKEALVSYGKEFKIRKVPIIDAESNALIDTTSLKIVNNDLVGSTKFGVSGYPKIDYFNDLEQIKSEAKLKEFYNTRLRKGNNKFLIDAFMEKNKYHYDDAFLINFNFKVEDYLKKLGDEIYINLNLNKTISRYKTDKKRKNAIEFKHKKYFAYTTTLEIPEGYKVDYLPENIDVSNDYISSKIIYSLEDDAVNYHHVVKLKTLTFTKEQQSEVNKLIKKIEKNYKEIVILKKQ